MPLVLPSISLTSENIFAAADLLLVPVIPTTLSLRTLEQLQEFCKRKKYSHLKIVPFLSMVDRRKKLHCEVVDDPPKSLKFPGQGVEGSRANLKNASAASALKPT